MKSRLSIPAAAIALVLHAALVAAVVTRVSKAPDRPVEPIQVTLQTLPEPLPVAPEPAPPQPSPPEPPPPEPPPPEPEPPPPPEPPPLPPKPPEPPKKKAETPRPRPPKPVKKAEPKEATPPVEERAALPEPALRPPAPIVPSAPVAPQPPAPPAPPPAPVRTGISIPATHAASNRKPAYPPMSQRYGEEGTVVLRVFVQADGTAGKVEIKKSSGYPLLDESARSAVVTWRFNPATVDGKAVSEWYEQPIPFTLQD